MPSLGLSAKPHDCPPDSAIEFLKDRSTALARLRKTRLALLDLSKEYLPIMAYAVLLDAAISNLERGQNKMFYFPIPWETDTGLPSHPSLVADARHYCKTNDLADTAGLIVDSFAEWRVFRRQKIFCCCGKGSANFRERFVPIEIVIHHPVNIDCGSRVLEIKQLVGIKSTDRDHVENHYNLRRDSRVNNDISIIGSGFVKLNIPDFELTVSGEEYTEQFEIDIFKKMFTEYCEQAFLRPV